MLIEICNCLTLVDGVVPLAAKAAVFNQLQDGGGFTGSHPARENNSAVGGCIGCQVGLHLSEKPCPTDEERVRVLLGYFEEQRS